MLYFLIRILISFVHVSVIYDILIDIFKLIKILNIYGKTTGVLEKQLRSTNSGAAYLDRLPANRYLHTIFL